MNNREKRPSPLYAAMKWVVTLVYSKIKVVGIEKLPKDACIIVANHSQLHGPLACELYFPGNRYIWCAGEMMSLKDVPAYAYRDFWSGKPGYSRWLYRLASYMIAPLSVLIFNNAHTVPVYRDARILTTFKDTLSKLQSGANVIIFPEHDAAHNNIVYEFQDRFIDIAKLYHKRTGLELSFVPMYIAPNLRQMQLGEPTRFRAASPAGQERERIRGYLMHSITDIARALPEHTVVPYRNIRKKHYPTNTAQEARPDEKAGG